MFALAPSLGAARPPVSCRYTVLSTFSQTNIAKPLDPATSCAFYAAIVTYWRFLAGGSKLARQAVVSRRLYFVVCTVVIEDVGVFFHGLRSNMVYGFSSGLSQRSLNHLFLEIYGTVAFVVVQFVLREYTGSCMRQHAKISANNSVR